jgi:hypothetical protein
MKLVYDNRNDYEAAFAYCMSAGASFSYNQSEQSIIFDPVLFDDDEINILIKGSQCDA